MELADLVVINKADIDPDAATRARAQITSSLRLLGMYGNADHDPHSAHSKAFWHPKVIQISALNGTGVDSFWASVTEFQVLGHANGKLADRRQHQALAWMWERIDAGLKQAFRQNPAVRALLPEMTRAVEAGQLAASTAARNLLLALEKTD
jgi:LAO/AO transport system kinase